MGSRVRIRQLAEALPPTCLRCATWLGALLTPDQVNQVRILERQLNVSSARPYVGCGVGAQQVPTLQYTAKFVCRKPISPDTVMPPVAPGTYYTAINVHNPSNRSVGFRKKFAVALPCERAGEVRGFFEAKLGPDEALEIDCQDILSFGDGRDRNPTISGRRMLLPRAVFVLLPWVPLSIAR